MFLINEKPNKIFLGENMKATAEKSTNYPQDVIDVMVTEYEANPTRDTVAILATQFEKSERSVIAKLSALGVYVPQPRPTKRPAKVRKVDLVADIQRIWGFEVASLVKASFTDLEKIRDEFESNS
jgi:hypothetical protein